MRVHVAVVEIALGWAIAIGGWGEQQQPGPSAFRDEPAAHALYDEMVETTRKAQSLY